MEEKHLLDLVCFACILTVGLLSHAQKINTLFAVLCVGIIGILFLSNHPSLAMIAIGLFYVLLPVDIVPELMLGPAGLVDDIIIGGGSIVAGVIGTAIGGVWRGVKGAARGVAGWIRSRKKGKKESKKSEGGVKIEKLRIPY